MTILKIPDMHCEKCVERITAALNAEKLKFKVSLDDKTVEIDGGDDDVKKAAAALYEIGFDAVK